MALLSSLYPDVLPYVPGCPDPMLDQEIRRAAIEFFRRSRAWMAWLDPIVVSSAIQEYDLDLPANAQVFRIEAASLNGREYPVSGLRALTADPSYDNAEQAAAVSLDRLSVVLTQALGDGDRLQIRAALTLSKTALSLDDALFDQHSDAIVEGAKYRLMRVPGVLHKPQEAQEARGNFEAAIAAASHSAWRGHTNATPRARVSWH